MSPHWSEEELLDFAMNAEPREGADHLRGCPDCGARFQRLLAEQDLLKTAFSEEASAPSSVRTSALAVSGRRNPISSIAALLLAFLLGGLCVLVLRPAGPEGSAELASLRERVRALEEKGDEGGRLLASRAAVLPASLDQMRRTVNRGRYAALDRGAPDLYALLSQVEANMSAEWLTCEISEDVALPPEEEERLRKAAMRLVGELMKNGTESTETEKSVRRFEDEVRQALGSERFRHVFESRAGENRDREIGIVLEDLRRTLPIEDGETGPIRQILEQSLPARIAPPAVVWIDLGAWDLFQQHPEIRAAVRASLRADLRNAFDQHVEERRLPRFIEEKDEEEPEPES